MALNTVSSDRLATNVKNTNFTSAEKQDLTNDILPLAGQLGNRNLIINGAMQVAQRGTSSVNQGYSTVDRFKTINSGLDEAPTREQADVASGATPYTLGFRKSFKTTNGNNTGGAGAADYYIIRTILEAQDIANSGWNYTSSSSFITLSFWVKSSVAQNFYGSVHTKDGTEYAYPFETGSLTADTWTKITKTIPGNSNLTFNNDSGEGLRINIFPFFGTDYTASSVNLNQWAAYSISTQTPDSTSTWYTTNDATFEITGVQLEVGSVATEFEHRSFSDELLKCQRYCQKLGASNGTYDCMAVGNAIYNTFGFVPHRLVVTMRSTPSFTLLGSASDFNYTRDGGDYAPTAIVLDQAGRNMVAVKVTGSNLSNDEAIRLFNMNTTGGYLFTAEL